MHQQSIIGSGGYMKEDVDDVQEIMACGKWNLESMITHEFPLEQLDQALYKASDVNNSLNVIIKMEKNKCRYRLALILLNSSFIIFSPIPHRIKNRF